MSGSAQTKMNTIYHSNALRARDDLNIDRVKQLPVEESDRVKYYDQVYGEEIQTAPADYLPGMGQLQATFRPFADNFQVLKARFFQPDADQPVTFVVNPNNAPVSGGGSAQVDKA